MSTVCPTCGESHRPDAKFCPKCGTILTQPARSEPEGGAVHNAKKVAAKAGAVAGPAVTKAAATLGPIAKETASKGWKGSKRGVGLASRMVTSGGRAAYSELFSPTATASGRIISSPTLSTGAAFLEGAALLFTLSLLAVWLLFLLSDVVTGAAIGVLLIGLLALSWSGLRRPYFTRLTFDHLVSRLRSRGQPAEVPILRFRIADEATGQTLDVIMVGNRTGPPPNHGEQVVLWGIRDSAQSELRAWKLQRVEPTGQLGNDLTAPRLIPLTVALFLPALLSLIVWLLSLWLG